MKRLLCAIFFLGCASAARADVDAPKIDPTKKATVAAPLADSQILTHVYLEFLGDRDVDQWAQTNAALTETRALAGNLLKDHRFFIKGARALAGRLAVKLNPIPAPHSDEEKKAFAQQRQFAQLKRLTGPVVDQRYRALLAKNSADMVHFIKRQRRRLPKDSPVYNWLGTVVPKIRDHYQVLSSSAGVQS